MSHLRSKLLTSGYAAILCFSFFTFGCDEGSGASAVISSFCDHQFRCKEVDNAQTCKENLAKELSPPLSQSANIEISSCLNNLDCQQSTDVCFEKAIETAQANTANAALKDTCLTKRSECSDTQGGSFSDDYCYSLMLLDSNAQNAAKGCLSKTCAETSACLKKAGAFS